MQRIPVLKQNKATQEQQEALQNVRRLWGRDLNISSTMAHNPCVLRGFLSFWSALDESGLSHEDREVICTEMAVLNECHYCIPAHLNISQARRVDLEMIRKIARGESLTGNSRAAKLQALTRKLVETGGKLSDEDLSKARADNFDYAQLVAILAEIAHCHFTNSFNRLVNTTPDAHFPPHPNDF